MPASIGECPRGGLQPLRSTYMSSAAMHTAPERECLTPSGTPPYNACMHARRSLSPSIGVVAPSHAPRKGAPGDDGAGVSASVADALSWDAPPLPMRIERAALAFAAVCITWLVALAAFHSLFIALVGSLAIIGSFTEVLFPIHHRVSAAGAFTRCGWQMRQMNWGSVKCARMGKDGIHLSPLRADARLSRVRGVTLRFADGNDEAVLATVRMHWKRDAV